jgi:outer membrane protein assembly factor BamB
MNGTTISSRASLPQCLLPLAGLALLLLAAGPGQGVEPWATYRGNLQRTGNTDGKAGPAAPKVLWVFKSQEHFIASPVPHGSHLFISGLGAFNVSTLYCLDADPRAVKRALWAKTTPLLKLPTVSSPAVAGNKIIFGDGMHQTDGAFLHCLLADKGMPLWELPAPGNLVHLEGSPTVVNGRVYVGGGSAGVICVDLDRVLLEGKEMDVASIQKILAARWKELLQQYEEAKKKDPDFAVPPSEDQLPRPTPRRLWQEGQEKWHVDAPVAVAGDKVLVGTAFLDREKLGDRALICLDAATGKQHWRTPLRLNPWGGPTVAGDAVVVGGSTIGYDTRSLKGAKGQVAVLDLATGKEKWHKDVTGGVLSSVAVADGLALATATDGKVRAFDLATGERRWIYEGGMPFFGPAAVAAGVGYAGDLKGVVHAIDLATGQSRWKLDLGTHADVLAPGMIYGGPVVHGGRLYVATCNLEGSHVRQPTVVVCIGDQ